MTKEVAITGFLLMTIGATASLGLAIQAKRTAQEPILMEGFRIEEELKTPNGMVRRIRDTNGGTICYTYGSTISCVR